MLEETTLGSSLTRKATLLVGEILEIANKVLPLSSAAKLQVWEHQYNAIDTSYPRA